MDKKVCDSCKEEYKEKGKYEYTLRLIPRRQVDGGMQMITRDICPVCAEKILKGKLKE